jgi:hypothetical protein
MQVKTTKTKTTEIEVQTPFRETRKPNPRQWILWLLLILAAIIVGALPFIGGTPSHKPIEKPEDIPVEVDSIYELWRYDQAEQYVLTAKVDGWYSCPSCTDGARIYLKAGEVWKYGVTINGQSGRYSDDYLSENKLHYYIQYKGRIGDCLKMEKAKIHFYPILPENLARIKPLTMPPGNSNH